MGIKCWPENDYYFRTGIEAKLKNIPIFLDVDELCFINLTKYNVGRIIHSESDVFKTGRSYIIVCNPCYIMLAHYYFEYKENVVSYMSFKDDNPLHLQRCILFRQNSIDTDVFLPKREKFSEQEIESLRMYLQGYTACTHASMASVSFKTIYTHRLRAVQKLGMKRLRELLILKEY